MRALRDLRPVLYKAVAPFLEHTDAAVRDAALITALPLAEHPDLTQRQDHLADQAHRLLSTSVNRHHRNRALDALTTPGP
ncbi:hypothetical protein [Streptomyces sp. NPDC046942]|uniref:hypothetical protein n=1 Tax=Streptomyces sp. NPDC046942 TaxID=3155137 RepID=UPI0033E8ABAD